MNAVEDFVNLLKTDLKELEAQIQTIDKVRIRDLNNTVLRKQCGEILVQLRKERDGLRHTIGSKTYKRMVEPAG